MILKHGYKQTELGVIPEEWEVKQLKHIVSEIIDNRGKTPPYSNIGSVELIETVSISFVNQYPDYSKVTKFVSNRVYNDWFRGHPIKNDILISTVGEYSGSTAMMKENKGTIAQNVIAIRTRELIPSYVFYWTRSESFKKQLTQVMMNQAQPSLRLPWLLNFFLSVPPTQAEQEAIVEALSDADALVESLEQLITKKRAIKQGAMQELLIGKRRLPGFSGGWEVKQLGEIADIIMGQSPGSMHYNSKGDGLPLIQGNADISNRKTIKRIFTTEVTKRGRCGDTLLTVRAPVGEVAFATFDICLGRGVCAIRYSNSFLYHALILNESVWTKLSKGSTFDSVNSTDVKAFRVALPTDKAEENAIAAILNDMDTEIAALEAKLTKARQIKQGLMQELLTGKTRLI